MGKLFGTDGVRGIANDELTNTLAYKLGRFGAYVIAKKQQNGDSPSKKKSKILVAKDTRISGDMLESAMIAGILSVGCDAILLGVMPTPAVAHLVRKLNADAGVMISASHNPVEYNGIKFFDSKGYKLPDEVENEIESYIFDEKQIQENPVGIEIGRKTVEYNAIEFYEEFIQSTVDVDFKGLKIVVDGANGAAYKVGVQTLEKMGAEVISIHTNPDGCNINEKCGSTHPEDLIDKVKSTKSDIGLAFDGDADRLIAVDELGNIVDGDKIMAICALRMKKENKLNKNTVVATVMSNLGFKKVLEEHQIDLSQTKVGDRYVLQEMKKGLYSIGGEQSGHVIFLDYNTTGDGLLTAVQLISVMKKSNQKLSDLAQIMKVYPQVLKNAKVKPENKHTYESDEVISEQINKVEQQFHGNGRVLIRPSGTEPLVRVMIEGENQDELEKVASELAVLIESRLG